jgi:hypothetical protein
METIYSLLALSLAVFMPFILQFIGLRFILGRKEVNILSLYFISRWLLTLFSCVIIIAVFRLFIWIQGKDSLLGVVLMSALGLAVTSLIWIFIFKSKSKLISFKDSFKGSILSLLGIFIVFLFLGINDAPNKTQLINDPKAFDDLFESTFTDNKLRKIINKISNKELVFQYSFVEGNNLASNSNCIVEVYKLGERIHFNKILPISRIDNENFSWLFDIENNIDLSKTSELNEDKLIFNVGHSENYIYSKINSIKLNWYKGSYLTNDKESSDSNGLYQYTDILIVDEINNQLIYIGKSGKNHP